MGDNWRQILSWQVAEPPTVLSYHEGKYELFDATNFVIEEVFTDMEAVINYLQKHFHLSHDRGELICRDAVKFGSCEF